MEGYGAMLKAESTDDYQKTKQGLIHTVRLI